MALVSATQLPGWDSLPALPLTNRNTQNSIVKNQNNFLPFCPCRPPIPTQRSASSMKTLPLLLLAGLVAIASGMFHICPVFHICQKCQYDVHYKLIVDQVTSGSPSFPTPFLGVRAPPLRRPRRTAPRESPAWLTSGSKSCLHIIIAAAATFQEEMIFVD